MTAESWDDDFGDVEDSNFLSSVSSAGSAASESFYQRPSSAANAIIAAAASGENFTGGRISSKPSRRFVSSEADKLDDDDYGAAFGDRDLTTKMSNLDLLKNRHQSSGKQKYPSSDYTGKITRLGVPVGNDVGGAGEFFGGAFQSDEIGGETYGNNNQDHDNRFLDDDEIQTIRVASSSGRRNLSNSNMLMSGDFYKPPPASSELQQPKQTIPFKKQLSFQENNDDDFDFDGGTENLADRLKRVNQTREAASADILDDGGSLADESLGFRTNSRLSTYSHTTSATTYETDTNDGDDGDDDFFGFSQDAAQVFDKPAIDLRGRLEAVKKHAQQESELERELLAKGHKYDTIRSSGSGNSIKNMQSLSERGDDTTITTINHRNGQHHVLSEDAELDEDLLDGIELDDGEDIISNARETLHRNVIIKSKSIPKQLVNRQQISVMPSRRNLRGLEVHSNSDIHGLTTSASTAISEAFSVKVKKSMPVLRPPVERSTSGRGNSLSPQKLPPPIPKSISFSSRRASTGVSASSGSGSPDSPTKPPRSAASRVQQQQQQQQLLSDNHRLSKEPQYNSIDDLGSISIDATSTLASRGGSSPTGKRLRPVQSMLNMQPRHGHGGAAAANNNHQRQLLRARRGPIYEGNELDQFDDLAVDVIRESKFAVSPKGKGNPSYQNAKVINHVSLDTFRERIPLRRDRQQHKNQQLQMQQQQQQQYQNQKLQQQQQQQLQQRQQQQSQQQQQETHQSTVRSPTKSSLLKDNSAQASAQKTKWTSAAPSRRKGRLGLIRNLGNPAAIDMQGNNGEMQFNPSKLVWEGNDIELKKFDSVNPKTPGLIAFMSNNGAQVVGNMIFDPDRLCWINTKEDTSDPFEGLDDLEISTAANSYAPGYDGLSFTKGNNQQNTRTESLASSLGGGEFAVGNEFNLNARFIEKLQHEDERWVRKTKGWFSPNEDFDRGYLHEIRSMVMRR